MEYSSRFFQLNSHNEKEIECGNIRLTPQSQSLIIGRGPGKFVWNRPLAVIVEREGKLERIPVIDLTRIAQLGIFAIGVIGSIIGIFKMIKKQKEGFSK